MASTGTIAVTGLKKVPIHLQVCMPLPDYQSVVVRRVLGLDAGMMFRCRHYQSDQFAGPADRPVRSLCTVGGC